MFLFLPFIASSLILSLIFPLFIPEISAGFTPYIIHYSHLSSCTRTKSNLYLSSSLETVITEPTLYKPPYTPESKSHIHILLLGSLIQRIRPGLRLVQIVRNKCIPYSEGLLVPHPTPKLEDHPLLFVRGCLFNIFAAALHSWRPFLHPLPKDVPWCGHWDSPNMVIMIAIS
jgi:hypothetical protein